MANSGYGDEVCQCLVHELFPLSVMISMGVQNRHMCRQRSFAADAAETVWDGNSSTQRVNVSMRKMINLNVMASGNGVDGDALHQLKSCSNKSRCLNDLIFCVHFLTCDTALDNCRIF